MTENILYVKSCKFADRIWQMCNFLTKQKVYEGAINQVFRSGTSIGANLSESLTATSRADFLNKMKISEKEAKETQFWLDRLFENNAIDRAMYESMTNDCQELQRLLSASVKTVKDKLNIVSP